MTGLFTKFYVNRVDGRDGPDGDKADARYFVLDYVHDEHARKALSAYAESVHKENPEFASDLRQALMDTAHSGRSVEDESDLVCTCEAVPWASCPAHSGRGPDA